MRCNADKDTAALFRGVIYRATLSRGLARGQTIVPFITSQKFLDAVCSLTNIEFSFKPCVAVNNRFSMLLINYTGILLLEIVHIPIAFQ